MSITKILGIALIFSFILSSCNFSKTNVTIKGNVQGDIWIRYLIPPENRSFIGKEIQYDEQGNFELSLFVSRPTFITFLNTAKPYILCVQPNNKYEISFNKLENNSELIAGINKEGHKKYQKHFTKNVIGDRWKYRNVSTVEELEETIQIKKENEIKEFQVLLDSNKIDKEFFDFIENDLNYYYAALCIRVSARQFDIHIVNNKGIKDTSIIAFHRLMDKQYKKFPEGIIKIAFRE